MKKSKLFLILALVLSLAVGLGGTLAYLTDTDSDVNVMALGNVSIEQHEQQRVKGEDGRFTNVLEGFKQGQALYPAYNLADEADSVTIGDYTIPFADNYVGLIDKIVTVTNTGASDAYVRTVVAMPSGGEAWNNEERPASDNWLHMNYKGKNGVTYKGEALNGYPYDVSKMEEPVFTTINGKCYEIYEFVYKEAVKPGETTYPSLISYFMDPRVNNDENGFYITYDDGTEARIPEIDLGGTVEILVCSQACQTVNFEALGAQAALDTAFGDITATNHPWSNGVAALPAYVVSTADELLDAVAKGGTVVLTKNIVDCPVDKVAPYGNYYGIGVNGQTLDGNNYVLDFNEGPRHNGKFDNYGIMTSGGTIKNVDLTGVFRAIMIMNPTETVYIDNVTIGDDDVCYAINTGEGDGTQDVVVTNSTIKGWSSYGNAIKSVTFNNCTFAQGTYYDDVFGRLVKPYVDAVFDGCEFNGKFYIDLSALTTDGDGRVVNPDAKIILRNCTVNGVKLTEDNWTSLIVSESDCGEGQISIEGKDGSYMAAGNVFDYVIIE